MNIRFVTAVVLTTGMLLVLLAAQFPSAVCADGPADLQAGRAAMQSGELEKAVGLLSSAAEQLPDSVPALLALADCQLKMGKLGPAAETYRRLLKISPNHRLARRVLTGLAGHDRSVQQQLQAARDLMEVRAYVAAQALLQALRTRPLPAVQRETVTLQLLQCSLRLGHSQENANQALSLAARTSDEGIRRAARLVALLNLLPVEPRAASRLSAAWKTQIEETAEGRNVLQLIARLSAPEEGVASGEVPAVLPLLKALPASPFRDGLLSILVARVQAAAERERSRGNLQQALTLIWQLASSGAVPDNSQVLKPIALQGGLLSLMDAPAARDKLLQRLSSFVLIVSQEQGRIAATDEALRQAEQRALWLAAELARQMSSDKGRFPALLNAANRAGNASRPKPAHAVGTPLSVADQIQTQLLFRLAELAQDERQRQQIAPLVVAQIQRYHSAGDFRTGLAQWATWKLANRQWTWRGSYGEWPASPARHKLETEIAQLCQREGRSEFEKQVSSQVKDANRGLNEFDRLAMLLVGHAARFSQTKPLAAIRDGVVRRYSDAQRWSAAVEAVELAYAGQEDRVVQTAVASLLQAQVHQIEARQLGDGRRLPDQLHPLLLSSLQRITAVFRAGPSEENRSAVISFAEFLVQRYEAFGRYDLATAVPLAVEAGAPPILVDWSLWRRAELLGRQVERDMAVMGRVKPVRALPLQAGHQQQIKLLDSLIQQHPRSPYVPAAVERLFATAARYRQLQSPVAARQVLQSMLAAHADHAFAPRAELEIVRIGLSQANLAFQKQATAGQTPQNLSEAHLTGLTELLEFLAQHQADSDGQAALSEVWKLMEIYGRAGSWPAVRDLIGRVAKRLPELRTPAQYEFLVAATWVGELDRQQGLMLVLPPPRQPRSKKDASSERDEAKVASATAMPEGKKLPPGQPSSTKTAQAGGGGGFGGGAAAGYSGGRYGGLMPNADALAGIRQAQRRQLSQIAMLENQVQQQKSRQQAAQKTLALPGGKLLTEAEIKRQDEAADQVYAKIAGLLKAELEKPQDPSLRNRLRLQFDWLVGYFESHHRPQRAIALIQRWLTDFPQSSQRIAWELRIISNRLAWAQLRETEKIDLPWLAQRNQRFETARAELRSFLKQHAEAEDWLQRARQLLLDSYQSQSRLAAVVSRVRAAGLLVQSVDTLLELTTADGGQADATQVPTIWDLAHQVEALGQNDPAIYCLSQLPIRFPTHVLAQQAVLRIAQLYAVNLANPIRAVEAYQEYLSVSGQEAPVRDAIFKLANDLSASQRFLEAIHAYNVFVDSFPSHAQAAAALLAIGQTHQTNEAWTEAIVAYRRILDEFPQDKLLPQVKFALMECQINLSQWREARRQYEDFLQKHPKDSRVAVANARLAVLKNLERYQNLLGDEQVQRNKDDAQFQIARIVQSQLQNPVKAVAEYREVIRSFPKSDLADDAQIEIGRILLGLNRLAQAREELLKVTTTYPNSPVADDALYLIGQSYEQQAQSLASVTVDRARKEVFTRNQRFAYNSFAQQQAVELQRQTRQRAQLQKAGKSEQLDLAEASNAFRNSGLVAGNLWNTARGAELQTESETALQVASRQDRINEAFRSAIDMYLRAASDYPLGDKTDQSLLRIAAIFENQLKDRASAMETYQKIVKLFPGTPVAEDAAWKVAVFYEQESKFTAAAAAFREFIRNYPASNRVADAQFSLAEVLEQLGKWVEAMDAYEVFRQKFGKHPKAQVAQAQINWIRTYRK